MGAKQSTADTNSKGVKNDVRSRFRRIGMAVVERQDGRTVYQVTDN